MSTEGWPGPMLPSPVPEPTPQPTVFDLMFGDVAEVRAAFDRLKSRRHDPDRPTAPGLPPRPIDYPRPTARR